MRIFAIRDEIAAQDYTIGYLVFYENRKAFYIELCDGIDSWNVPPILSSFADHGEYSINAAWSKTFVLQRIVPSDRQNLSQILADNGLKEYDEFSLLMLTMGHCEQDDFYLEEVPAEPLPELLLRRWKTKVNEVVPLEVPKLLVFFRNGLTKMVDVQNLVIPEIAPFLAGQNRFNTVELQPDGYGVCWNDQAAIPHQKLFSSGMTVPLSELALRQYVQNRVISASEACGILDCSRQNIDDLMRRDKLHPIRTDAKYKLFSKAEVLERKKL